MTKPDKKPCTQERIAKCVREHKWLSIITLVVIVSFAIFLLEIFGFQVIESFSQSMRVLEDAFPEAFKGVVTVFGGIITYIIGRVLYERYRRPILEIVRVDPLTITNEKYWRVVVKNTGKTAAENCTGSVHLLGKDANGKDVDVKGGVCWSIIDNPNTITINVEDEQALDIYRVHLTQPKFLFFEIPTEKGWGFLRKDGVIPISSFTTPPAKLQMRIRITAKNAKRCERIFSLNGQQNDVILISS